MQEQANNPAPSLLRRLTAMLYDSLLVIALIAVTNAVALGILVKVTGDSQELLGANLVRLLTLLSVFAFYCVFWLKSGQTLGMQAWRIKLVASDGGKLGLRHALLRCCAAIPSLAFLGLGYLWCLVDRKKRYWHDHLSGTELILLPKQDKTKNKSPGNAEANTGSNTAAKTK